jgi:1-deoxy-D-xylulose-5-phosphate reductoisomerase
MIGVAVLGATGSIGVSTLDVIQRHSDKYRVVALSANKQVERLYQQCLQFKPRYAVMVDDVAADSLREQLKNDLPETEVISGADALETIATLDDVDQVMAAIVGAAGLKSSLAAARAGKRILLANKESLVMSGDLFMNEVAANNAELLPIDSEHNAIFQCMPPNYHEGLRQSGVNRILLTASGGPFRNRDLDSLTKVTPEQAVAHPNWSMGRKISVDSATMMNKGLEVIEACWLFNTPADTIQVVIHPESVIHSMVSYDDGSVLAQMGNPDMRTPIAHAMAWPERMDSGVERLDLFQVAQLNFEQPDFARFPCLRLSYEAINQGGTVPAILNAANEIAVEAFLAEQIAFTDIPNIIEKTLTDISREDAANLDIILAADQQARESALQQVGVKS